MSKHYLVKSKLLVNPRPTNEDFVKYSFPSKNIEYMASGTPFLTTDLPGIPAEYKDYIFTIEDNCVDNVKTGIEKVLSLTTQERDAFGERAQKFVLENKNKYVQSKQIADFLDKLD